MQPLSFLVVVPDAARRRALVELLRAAGHRSFDTADGAIAAESLAAPGFDALLLDASLPSLDLGALRNALYPAAALAPVSLEAAERAHIARTLEHTAGNRRQAALILGISRSTLLHKIRRYGLDGTVPRRR
ncbi:MAG TPA: helix-turn-helix domain-containing protein [Gemmatimonadales bacterium]|jgi:DNA-binding NtrC family response regulator|nr:helix-turn-helix domain-containing protein [Gemmatimonadales bacterium]